MNRPLRASEKLKDIALFLKENVMPDPFGLFNPQKEAEAILADGLGINKVTLLRDDPELSSKQLKRLAEMLRERVKGKPLQYIIGHADFYGLKIYVGEGVLIPRPETELIVEEALKRFKISNLRLKILDLCTGSGCLALAIAKNLPNSEVYAVDISDKALSYAKKNAKANNVKNVKFLKGSLFEPLKGVYDPTDAGGRAPTDAGGRAPTDAGGRAPFDLIVSNPPYIKSSIIPTLQREVKDWEPIEALDGGEDGLFFIKQILKVSQDYLKPGGIILLEIAQGQAEAVTEIAEGAGIEIASIIKDYSSIDRVFIGEKRH